MPVPVPVPETNFGYCCGHPLSFLASPPSHPHLIYTSFSTPICTQHPHDHANCDGCKGTDVEVPGYVSRIGGENGKLKGVVVVGSQGAKINLWVLDDLEVNESG